MAAAKKKAADKKPAAKKKTAAEKAKAVKDKRLKDEAARAAKTAEHQHSTRGRGRRSGKNLHRPDLD